MGIELEDNELFVDIERNPYGVLTFRIQLESGRIFPVYPLQETVLGKKSRKRLRDAHDKLVEQNAEIDE